MSAILSLTKSTRPMIRTASRRPTKPTLTEYDKELADSFPASDPPSQP